MRQVEINSIFKHWLSLAPYLSLPKTDKDLAKKIQLLDELLDIIGDKKNHPLLSFVDLISNSIEQYENLKYKDSYGSGIDALKFLIQEHGLTQSQLPEIGSQGVVSEILSGKRQLNRDQIQRLSDRFGVSPATFFD